MNVDLFLNPHGESGLLCDRLPGQSVAGVIYDAQTREMTLEIADETQDPLHLNIAVEDRHTDLILLNHRIYIGALCDGMIGLTLEVPLLYLNDPYGSHFNEQGDSFAPRKSFVRFEQFMKRCTTAQPLHRHDLGDESLSQSVLRGLDPKALEYVPALLRQRLLETAPKTNVALSVPVSAGPTGMGNQGTVYRQISRDETSKDE